MKYAIFLSFKERMEFRWYNYLLKNIENMAFIGIYDLPPA